MKLVPSPRFARSLRRMDAKTQERVRRELKLFLQDRAHPSLRYKAVQALKNESPPVMEISISMTIRVTLQVYDDHVFLRNLGGHDILP
jgi:mRNA-degrading endonuclease RelE of RelBE toxin-antitoxin system